MANLDTATLAPKIAQAKSAGYSDDEIVNFLSEQAPEKFKQAKDAGYSSGEILSHFTTAKPETRNWADVPGEAVSNIPSSAGHLVAGAAKMAADVGGYVLPKVATKGGLMGAATSVAQDAATSLYNDPDLIRKIPAAAWKGLVERYGSEEAVKKTIATDPVGFALDASMLIQPVTGAARGAARGAGAVADIGRAADVSRPFHEIPRMPERPPPLPAEPPPIPPEPGLAAVREAVESQPRALTTDNRLLQQSGQVVSKVPAIGEPIGRAIEAVPGKFGEARDVVADQFGDYRTRQNVAGDIGERLRTQAATETGAAEAAARQADEAARAAHERTMLDREAAITESEHRSTRATDRQIGNAEPTLMGDAIADTVRENHARATAAKDAAYERAAAEPGAIKAEGMTSLYPQAMSAFNQTGRALSNLTPAANNVREALRNLSDLVIPENMHGRHVPATGDAALSGLVVPEGMSGAHIPGAGANSISVQGLNLFRKNIAALARQASTAEDAAAARVFTRAFDEWQNRVMGTHLASGNPEAALRLHQQANAANRDLMQRFGYNERNDADRLINKIVQPGNQIGPDDISKALFAPGNKPARTLDAIYEATADHPGHGNVRQAVRSGFWNKIAGAGEGVTARRPEKIASDINAFMNNREMASRIFDPEHQALGRAHAQTLRQAAQARAEAPAIERAGRPVPTEVTKGPMQELADRVIGGGQKSEEALYNTIEGYAKGKGGGKDVATLGRLMASLPEELRGNFRNVFVRRLGEGVKGEFSPATFAKEWLENINPQAKAVLFGNGTHVRALDELAAASKKFDEVHRRFGNPSGSGQAVNFAKIAGVVAAATTGALMAPLKLGAGWFAGRQFSHFLATPQGAMSASRFVRSMQRLQDAPTLANAVAAKLTVRNMGNTATALGIPHTIPSLPNTQK